MAQAEFERNSRQGGFDSASYRAPEPGGEARELTPLQQKLAALEKALPKALRTRAAALLLAVVLLAAGAVGIGGGKVAGRPRGGGSRDTAGGPAGKGDTPRDELKEGGQTAAHRNTNPPQNPRLGAESGAVQAAQVALDGFTACQEAVAAGGAGMAEMYRADEALDSAINLLYGQMQELADDPLDMGAVGQQYGRFNSAGTVLGSLHYNEAVLDYQKDTGGPWASVLKGLFGIKEVEVFG